MHDENELEARRENKNVAALRATYVFAWLSAARLAKLPKPSTEALGARFDALLAQHDSWVIAQHDAGLR